MSVPAKRRSPAGKAELRDRTDNISVSKHITNTGAEAQRQRLLTELQHRAINTIDARRDLNILMLAARVKELRQRGHDVVTRLMDIHDDQGRPHSRVALYSLISGGAK